ncbi:crustapain-like [Hermetia illucens]|nr:crustapain-like [Hermetia illucens]XP_037917543.1 crustapain-like [Hermetia illucens]
MKLVLLFTVFITLAAIKAQPVDKEGRTGPTGALDEEWENFKTKFNKRYKNAEEEEYRKGIFAKSLKKIQEHNKKYDAGEVSFKQGINHLADLTVNEYRAGYLGISKTVM